MARNLYDLYHSHFLHVAKQRDIKTSGMVDVAETNKAEARALYFLMLDSVLGDHRKKYGTQFNQLPDKQALVHFLVMKYQWTPKQINEMSLAELLLVVQDDLRYDKMNEQTQKFLDTQNWSTINMNFDDFLENEWDPSIGGLYLRWRPNQDL